jgi:hemerythrin superfamily protein
MIGTAFRTDAIGLLKDDHREVEDLLQRFEARADAAGRLELAQEICQALTVHAQVEETLFYPALRRAGMEHALLDAATVEHQSLRERIAELDGIGPASEGFEDRVRLLGKHASHHFEEEEDWILPQARSLDLDLDALGEEILAMKTQLEVGLARRLSPAAGRHRIEVLPLDGRGLLSP